MESLTHFAHEHPLSLLKKFNPEKKYPRSCNACPKSVYDSEVYGCEICKNFVLHKSCAELPMEIVHKSHEQHPLFLLSEQPACYKGSFRCGCRHCLRRYRYPGDFLYHCYLCQFDLYTNCVLREKESIVSFTNDFTLCHPSHKHHQLKLEPRPSSFRCDACDVKDEDLSYRCTSCNYWIHRRCAMLPSTKNHHVHTHPLSLSFGLPSQYHDDYFDYSCDICNDNLHEKQKIWFYYCEPCRYFVHLKCMEIKKPQIEVDLRGLKLEDLPRLPMNDKSVEMIQRFLLGKNSLGNVEQDISIFSHNHPLKYSNDEQVLKDEDEDGEEVLCDGCIGQIVTPPFYHCAECRYFLHIPCAKLPHQLQHPRHPHPLILTSKTRFYDGFICNLCDKRSNGFVFRCSAEGCNYNLDVQCASLQKHVVHETHNHPLFQEARSTKICRGCFGTIWYSDIFLGCDPCSFYLHVGCLLLPKTRKSRFDSKHHLVLRYPPHSYHPRPLDCAECEEEINPYFWLYHCEECDLSFHVYCIDPSWRSNNFKFGQKLQISSHPHPLRYVFEASVKSPCHSCGGHTYRFCSECETCNFHICQKCLPEIEPSSSTR